MLTLIISILLLQPSVGEESHLRFRSTNDDSYAFFADSLRYVWNENESTYILLEDSTYYIPDTLIVYTSSDFETILIKNSDNEVLMNIDLTELEE